MSSSDADDAIRRFIEDLRKLRRANGDPSLRRLQELEPGLRKSTISKIINGDAPRGSLPDFGAFVVPYVRAVLAHGGHGRQAVDAEIDKVRGRYGRLEAEVEGSQRAVRLRRRAIEQQTARGPRQLPPLIPHFTGRTAELAELGRLVDAHSTVVISAIDGMAGVGKTELAVHLAHRIADRFPHGVLYLNLQGFAPAGQTLTAAQAARRFLDAFGLPPLAIPGDPDSVIDTYRTHVSDKRLLLVLDNAGTADQVRPLLPGSAGSLAIVTSRRRLGGLVTTHGARLLTLGQFAAAESLDLLTNLLGAGRVSADPAATAEIIERCAGLPLALTVIAARAVLAGELPLGTLARELRDTASALDGLRVDPAEDDPLTTVRTVFSWSYRQLDDGAARLFRLLGLHPGPDLTASAAASLSGTSRALAAAALGRLAEAHLVEPAGDGRFACHDLLRTYAAELVEQGERAPDRRLARHRMVDHYLHTAYQAGLRWDPHRDRLDLAGPRPRVRPEVMRSREQAFGWFSAEYPVLRNVVLLAATGDLPTEAWQLGWALADFLNRQGHWHDWLEMQLAALAAAERAGDVAGQARTHRGVGRAYAAFDRTGESLAHLRTALTLFAELGDQASLGHTHVDLARTHDLRNDFAAALDESWRAVACFTTAGHGTGRANALNGVGWYEGMLGRYEDLLTHCREALDAATALRDNAGCSAALDSLGYGHHHLGQHRRAISCYRRAVRGFAKENDPLSQAGSLDRLGDSLLAVGRRDEARTAWAEAQRLYDDVGAARAAKAVRAKTEES